MRGTELLVATKLFSPFGSVVAIAILTLVNYLTLALSDSRERDGRMQEQSGLRERETDREFTVELAKTLIMIIQRTKCSLLFSFLLKFTPTKDTRL
jgi:hypothetical protein